jgi:hypothetical protein
LEKIISEHLLKILFSIVVLVFVTIVLINQHFNKKFARENFDAVEAEITFVFNTGRGTRAKTKLDIEYIYNNQKVKTKITRRYNGNDYYKKGDIIIIYINQNNENDIR